MTKAEAFGIVLLSIALGLVIGLPIGYHCGITDTAKRIYSQLTERDMGHFEMDKKTGTTVFVFHRNMEKE